MNLNGEVGTRNAECCTSPSLVGMVSAVVIGLLGLASSVAALFTGASLSWQMAWSIPVASIHLGLDPLSAFFLIPISVLGMLCAVYGAGYLKGHADAGAVRISWLNYNLLFASMVLVVLARNAIVFLLAWETMALTSFFLVTFDHHKAHVRAAGWIYLIATHLGTAFVIALFAILGHKAGSFEFEAMAQAGMTLTPFAAGIIFVFAVIGFGAKAGFIPVHVWLPEAHPAAPSHVSALMSGVMIKTGIYALLRVLSFLNPAPWWGWTLLIIGLASGLLGVLYALSQHDLKRLLAYCSVENVGIINIGLGMGYIGVTYNIHALAFLGFAGALLHVVNHALFKSLLFFGAGAILHATGTTNINHLGGLYKHMPRTGLPFLIGTIAICGLPPLNGFISEFLLYMAAFQTVTASPPVVVVACLLSIAGLALMGGLAVATFTKAFGMIFLGEPRTACAQHVHDANGLMKWSMAAAAAMCVLIGVAASVLLCATPTVNVLLGQPALQVSGTFTEATESLSMLTLASWILIGLIAALALLRKKLLAGRTVAQTVTWDCGYANPEPRMQYTASSFAQPLVDLFRPVLRTRRLHKRLRDLMPATTAFATEPHDVFRHKLYDLTFGFVVHCLSPLRRAQHGRVQLYVLYIALTLIALLVLTV